MPNTEKEKKMAKEIGSMRICGVRFDTILEPDVVEQLQILENRRPDFNVHHSIMMYFPTWIEDHIDHICNGKHPEDLYPEHEPE